MEEQYLPETHGYWWIDKVMAPTFGSLDDQAFDQELSDDTPTHMASMSHLPKLGISIRWIGNAPSNIGAKATAKQGASKAESQLTNRQLASLR